jgi:iron complex transport system ATP-binding protein
MGCAARVGLLSQPGKREREDTTAALEALGIAHLAARPYTTLSGGERQQAVIARAIVNRPRAVLFDEPTAHLDLGNQLRVLRIIRRFADTGLAVVITTHNPDHALLLGGRTAILDGEGRLRSGKTEELVTADTLRAVYGEMLTVEYFAELGRKVCVLPGLQL